MTKDAQPFGCKFGRNEVMASLVCFACPRPCLAQDAAQKGRVYEELVTDLSNVVSQQKLHIQVRLCMGMLRVIVIRRGACVHVGGGGAWVCACLHVDMSATGPWPAGCAAAPAQRAGAPEVRQLCACVCLCERR